jgi:hypothetical protein
VAEKVLEAKTHFRQHLLHQWPFCGRTRAMCFNKSMCTAWAIKTASINLASTCPLQISATYQFPYVLSKMIYILLNERGAGNSRNHSAMLMKIYFRIRFEVNGHNITHTTVVITPLNIRLNVEVHRSFIQNNGWI